MGEQTDPQFLEIPRELLEVDGGSSLVHERSMLDLEGLHRTHAITILGRRICKAIESEVRRLQIASDIGEPIGTDGGDEAVVNELISLRSQVGDRRQQRFGFNAIEPTGEVGRHVEYLGGDPGDRADLAREFVVHPGD